MIHKQTTLLDCLFQLWIAFQFYLVKEVFVDEVHSYLLQIFESSPVFFAWECQQQSTFFIYTKSLKRSSRRDTLNWVFHEVIYDLLSFDAC